MLKFLHLLPVLLLFTLCLLTMTKAPVAARWKNRANRRWHRKNSAPTECKGKREGKTYCLNVPNYDQVTRLNEISKEEISRFEGLFDVDVPQLPTIEQRMSDIGDIYHCENNLKTIYPQRAITRDGTWMYIVNNERLKQGVLVELCENEGKICRFSDTLPNQYTSTCRQHFLDRVLIAVAANNTMIKQLFRLPSSCKCVIKQSGFDD